MSVKINFFSLFSLLAFLYYFIYNNMCNVKENIINNKFNRMEFTCV